MAHLCVLRNSGIKMNRKCFYSEGFSHWWQQIFSYAIIPVFCVLGLTLLFFFTPPSCLAAGPPSTPFNFVEALHERHSPTLCPPKNLIKNIAKTTVNIAYLGFVHHNEFGIKLKELPESFVRSRIRIAIDPFTDVCEIRFGVISDGSTITFDQRLVYSHRPGAVVLLDVGPAFYAEFYGLQQGQGYSSSIHTGNSVAIKRAVENAGLMGGGEVILPPGKIEFHHLRIENFPDNVSIVGAGRDATTLIPQGGGYSGKNRLAAFIIEGRTTSVISYLMADAASSDNLLSLCGTYGFSAGDLIRIRDLSTGSEGNGSWPYDPRPGLFNGEYLYVKDTNHIRNELQLVTPVQSSVRYQVRNTTVVAPGASVGSYNLPVVRSDKFAKGTGIVVIQDDGTLHIATVVALNSNNFIQIDIPLTADVSSGKSVFVQLEVCKRSMAKGVGLANFSLRLKATDENNGGIIISNLDGFTVENVAVYGAGWVGIKLTDCVNGNISNFLIQDGEFSGSKTGYGLQTYNCQWVNIGYGIVRKQRRAIDLSGIHPSRYINVHDNLLEGSAVVEGSSVAGTHGTAEYCNFTDNTFIGGRSVGLIIRGNNITVAGNRFYGQQVAAILLKDGARWNVIGNVVDGYRAWGVNSGGRFAGEFIRLRSPRAVQLISRGNIVHLDNTHIDVRGEVRGASIWVSDDIVFGSSASGGRNIIFVHDGSSIVLDMNVHARGYDTLVKGKGNVAQGESSIIFGRTNSGRAEKTN